MGENINYPGLFFVLDGIDGCGKSTQTALISDYFLKNQIKILRTAEPSNGDLGKILRKILKDPETPAALDSLVFAADRIDHCNSEILPALQEGKIVLSDRYRESSYVYQSIQGQSSGITLDWIKELNKFSLEPDLTFILDLDPKIALERKFKQNQDAGAEMEKFENINFQKAIRKAFLDLVNGEEQIEKKNKTFKYIIIDANQDIDRIFNQILSIIIEKAKEKQIL
ncbi:MAG: dTMP kinase [Promethearchaeota archaeon]